MTWTEITTIVLLVQAVVKWVLIGYATIGTWKLKRALASNAGAFHPGD